MIFHKYKLIFVGIPKNASHAPFAVLSNKTDQSHDHTFFMDIYHNNDEDLIDTYTSFAICRDPYDRAYSAWNYLTIIEDLPNRFDIHSFKEYIYALESRTYFNKEMESEELTMHELTYPQHKFISFKNQILIDKVLRYENLDADWKEFADEYNKTAQFKIKNTLKRHNDMHYEERDWSKVYTPEMYKIINEFYKKDFELFNYEMRTK